MMTLENRLVHIRKKAGYTQKELAKALNITARTVQRYEKNASCLTVNIATELSFLCKVDLTWLLTGNMPSDSSNLTRVIVEHQDLVTRFKNPERAKEINEDLLLLEDVDENGVEEVHKIIKIKLDMKNSSKKTPKTGEDIQDKSTA